MWRFWRFWRFWLSFRVKLKINFVLQTVLFSLNQTFTEITCGGGDVNIVRYQVRLADHLTRGHKLSGIERKYWLQFA